MEGETGMEGESKELKQGGMYGGRGVRRDEGKEDGWMDGGRE